jgi:hypothetical protein
MKTTVGDILDTIESIDITCKSLEDILNKLKADDEAETVDTAISLLKEYERMIYRCPVEM